MKAVWCKASVQADVLLRSIESLNLCDLDDVRQITQFGLKTLKHVPLITMWLPKIAIYLTMQHVRFIELPKINREHSLSWAASLVLRAHEHVPWRRWGGTHRVFRQHCNCSVWMCVGFLTEGLERKDDPTKCSCSLLYTVIFIPCVRCLSCFDIYVFSVFATEEVSACNTKWFIQCHRQWRTSHSVRQQRTWQKNATCTVRKFYSGFHVAKFHFLVLSGQGPHSCTRFFWVRV